MSNKVIFHIDFDSYFVSAHRTVDFSLKNKPVGVGKKGSKSICSSISYELKNKGVKVAWPKFKILQYEPNTIFVEPNFDLYITLSNKIFDYISKKYSKLIEVFSIDECWLDVTDLTNIDNSLFYANIIKKDILETFDIPISIGISYNKFLAKMSSDLAKPFGITLTKKEDIEKNIWKLPIEKYFGIGKSSSVKLRNIKINTIEDLAKSSHLDQNIYNIFGKRTQKYINEANGISSDELELEHNELKEIGNEVTFSEIDIDDKKDIYKIIKMLSEKVSHRAYNRSMLATVISFLVRNNEGKWYSKQITFKKPTNDFEFIYKTSIKLFDKYWNEELIKGVGIRLKNLIFEFDYYKQLNLFEDYKEDNSKINNLIRNINNKFKKSVLKTGYQFEREKTKNSIQSRYIQNDILKK
ncbi:DNA polymerase IV [Mycoplasmopsis maculosa]|uniref:DNA polymerase IV n=1 Tax=Mycoplasmopsis maculosa TaxID=114885 RepID=A0A449B4C1_9BACT|nr:DNA polymerase IV [Mycoplasmopsis maculosa]VEU75451.1 DNA polymerase IV [Mycoplasmopsis maculosa]